MKKILCYGDSNTYGFIPETCERYSKDSRWTGILQKILGENFNVIEEGMNNRTGFFKNPEGLKYSGLEYFPVFLQNHQDIDLCILSLGTNDAQFFYNLDENIIKEGLQEYLKILNKVNPETKILIIPPVKITKNILQSNFRMMFDKNSINKIETTFTIYEEIAVQNGCYYLDLNQFAKPSEIDGLHYDLDTHKNIANIIGNYIKTFIQI